MLDKFRLHVYWSVHCSVYVVHLKDKHVARCPERLQERWTAHHFSVPQCLPPHLLDQYMLDVLCPVHTSVGMGLSFCRFHLGDVLNCWSLRERSVKGICFLLRWPVVSLCYCTDLTHQSEIKALTVANIKELLLACLVPRVFFLLSILIYCRSHAGSSLIM